MAWTGNLFFGYNGDGYGDYTDGMFVRVNSSSTSDADSTLVLITATAREYAEKLVEEGYDMPYDWNWGEVFSEIPDEVLASAGIEANVEGVAMCIPHDEIVVAQIM